MSRRDQVEGFIARGWNPLILRVITRLVLGQIGVVPNESGHRAYTLHTRREVLLIES